MSQRERDTIIHLVAGGVAGTVGAIVTCPLEVVKTRLQSSSAFLYPPRMRNSSSSSSNSSNGVGAKNSVAITSTTTAVGPVAASSSSGTSSSGVAGSSSSNGGSDTMMRPEQRRKLCTTILCKRPQVLAISQCGMASSAKSVSIAQCLRLIVQTEGSRALFKGLGPNIVGVAPSRAIYFCTYSQTKAFLNAQQQFPADSPIVHLLSASCAGFAASTTTNPIWFVKTRLQLDYNSKDKMTVTDCIRRIYRQSGFLGFYKGISASYVGISETVIHFVIYEALKAKLIELRETHPTEGKTSRDFLEFMLAGACSKTIASCVAYPHEVARTRLREEGNKYRSFWQTLHTVYKEEGKAGIYRGLGTQLVRQIPNTAIMMATYEAVVYVLTRHFNSEFYSS